MEMDLQTFLDNVHDLTDLELAILLSLIAQQNCLITTDENLIDDLCSELALIVSEVFNLSYAVVSSEDSNSVEEFGEAILDQNPDHDFGRNTSTAGDYLQPHSKLASVNIRAGSIAPSHASHNLDSRTVANVVIAKNFNLASRQVQIAALELTTRRRIYSRTTVHQVPKTFLFLPIVSTSTKHTRLNDHLNDRISISHFHDPADGFANLEELDSQHLDTSKGSKSLPTTSNNNNGNNSNNSNNNYDSDKRSTYSDSSSSSTNTSAIESSVRRHKQNHPQQQQHQSQPPERQITSQIIEELRSRGQSTTMTPEVRRHIQDVVVFLRIARGVDGGVTPFATTQFVNLTKYLAPLHGIDFVTPSLVALAARKVYAHRLVIATPERERSVQWGSDLKAVEEMLGRLTPEKVIEEVLATVPCPV